MIASLQIEDVVPGTPFEMVAQIIFFGIIGFGIAWGFSNLFSRVVLNTVLSYILLSFILVSLVVGWFFFDFLYLRVLSFVDRYPFGMLMIVLGTYIGFQIFPKSFPIVERLRRLREGDHRHRHHRH